MSLSPAVLHLPRNFTALCHSHCVAIGRGGADVSGNRQRQLAISRWNVEECSAGQEPDIPSQELHQSPGCAKEEWALGWTGWWPDTRLPVKDDVCADEKPLAIEFAASHYQKGGDMSASCWWLVFLLCLSCCQQHQPLSTLKCCRPGGKRDSDSDFPSR